MTIEGQTRCCKRRHAGTHAEYKLRYAATYRAWREKNKERKAEYGRRYRKANAAALREYRDTYRSQHREHLLWLHRSWYLLNKGRVFEQSASWNKSHRDVIRRGVQRWRDQLSDGYVVTLLNKDKIGGGRLKLGDLPRSLIEAKRAQLLLMRATK